MSKSIVFLSGLPRTGSTLLTSILSQNPEIHTEGNSALCQLMWDMQVSCWNTQQLTNKPEVQDRLLSSIPEVFYQGIDSNIIDKCRSWTLPANLELIDRYITKSPKFIVMLRSIVDIARSFVFIRKMNNWSSAEDGLLQENSEPIMRSLDGIRYAKSIDSGQFLYLWYDDLIDNPQQFIEKIYKFCGWKQFNHKYEDIININPERDDLLNLIGLHDIRSNISRRKLDITLSKSLYKKAVYLDKELNALIPR